MRTASADPDRNIFEQVRRTNDIRGLLTGADAPIQRPL
jgi:hypothetical protein